MLGRRALRAFDIPSASLQLEVTEASLLKNPDEAVSVMRRIKQLSVKIALGDFGKGDLRLRQTTTLHNRHADESCWQIALVMMLR